MARVIIDDSSSSACAYPALPPPVRVRLTTLPEHPCPYLPGRLATNRAFLADQLDPEIYHALMDAGFRRSGKLLYQPVCRGCRACVPVRVPVNTFQPSASQRRCLRKNADLKIEVGEPCATEEKFELYQRYLRQRHEVSEPHTFEEFEAFLYESPLQTLEFIYRDSRGRLLGSGICDLSSRSLSSVYFYFEPAERRRGLGTFGALKEIESAQRLNVPHYYLGYFVEGCRSMEYKAAFRPHELLHPNGMWTRG